jgi:type I restriction enzyme M protein
MNDKKNMFCSFRDISNEADVEALFIERMLETLNYPDSKIKRKDSLDSMVISRGSIKENYKPDYVLYDSAGKPIIVLDAKSPDEEPSKYHYQVSGYALQLNQGFPDANPVRYAIVTNGRVFIVWPWDSNSPIFYLNFEDFEAENEKWKELNANISYSAFKEIVKTHGIFKFERPEISELVRTFEDLHNTIRKKNSLGPTDAFYEFVKMIFIKIREDNKIHNKIEKGKNITIDDFVFSTQWLAEQIKYDPNPFNNILFRQLRDELELKIKKGEKKRIFDKNEELKLTHSTIYDIVERLQHYDLHAIDEDLNGRMFETFLNATVKGKDLGQFFTPRGVVHYMVETSLLGKSSCYDFSDPNNAKFSTVLDGCCGSGGFLIDAMTKMIKQVRLAKNLTNSQQSKIINRIKTEAIMGIDSASKIARISRLNMYLHSDGGSNIFEANTLDKELRVDENLPDETKEAIEQLRAILRTKKFDVVLTNPPFSINYTSERKRRSDESPQSIEDEKRILAQYDIVKKKNGNKATSAQSNILFLERYKELIKDDTGELITIIDDTVLNGDQSQRVRDWILENFVIVQIVSLPFNTFFRADANIKTSLIHLRRKQKGEQQGEIFMAITNNIGIDDHQNDTPERNNLPTVLKYYLDWISHGDIDPIIINNNNEQEETLSCPLQIFTVSPEKLNPQRLDAFYYSPELTKIRAHLEKQKKKGLICIRYGYEFSLIPPIKKEDERALSGKLMKYFEISDVTRSGVINSFIERKFEILPTRGRLMVNEGDVIFAKNISSRGTATIIPNWFSGNLVTTGFIGIRPKSNEEGLLLWVALESEIVRKQIYYLAITASQPEIRDKIFKESFMLPWPCSGESEKNILSAVKKVEDAKTTLNESLINIQNIFNENN